MSTEKTQSDEEKNTNEETVTNEESSQEENSSDEEVLEEVSSEEVEVLDEKDIKIQELEAALETRSSEVDEVTARLRSVSAAYSKQGNEIKATRARLERQMQYTEAKNRGEVVSSLFEPFDNLKRCLDGLRQSGVETSHIEGLEMVIGTFVSAFQKLGLEEIPGKGSTFDPNIHEALLNIPVPDPALNGIVVDVHSTGYRINDIIIKPAKVIVGVCDTPPEPPADLNEASEEETPVSEDINEEIESGNEDVIEEENSDSEIND